MVHVCFIKEVQMQFHQFYSRPQDTSLLFHRTLKLILVDMWFLTIHLSHLHKLERQPVCQYDALSSTVVTLAWSWTSLHSDELFSDFTPLLVVSVACSCLLVHLTVSDWSDEVGFCESECVTLLESCYQEIKSINNKKYNYPFHSIGQYYKSAKKWI